MNFQFQLPEKGFIICLNTHQTLNRPWRQKKDGLRNSKNRIIQDCVPQNCPFDTALSREALSILLFHSLKSQRGLRERDLFQVLRQGFS